MTVSIGKHIIGDVMTEILKNKPRPSDDCYRILVLDDNKEQMQAIKTACLAVQQEVVPVTSIAEGIKFLNTKDHVDVVVAEAFLERESVFDLISKLRKMPDHASVPIMIIAVDPGEVGRFLSTVVEDSARKLGVCKFVIMNHFDVSSLMREVAAILPNVKLPKRVSDPSNES